MAFPVLSHLPLGAQSGRTRAGRLLNSHRPRPAARRQPGRGCATPRLAPLAAAVLAWVATGAAHGQAEPTEVVTITGSRGVNHASVAGFGDGPLHRSPLSATVLTLSQLRDAGIANLADITRLDAGLTDAYNAPGYWGQVAVRGYTLDNRFNFRRDGLPVNAETVLPMANKAALELLKGTSGIQAGTSAPGGLLNLLVKRPLAQDHSVGTVEWVQPGTWSLGADLSRRTGAEGALGWRVNAQATRLDPGQPASRGTSSLLGAAAEWRTPGGAITEVEAERARQSQPSTPGFSLLGLRLPNAADIDPRLNLNNQSWSLPVVFEGTTASVRHTQPLGERLVLTAHLMQQRLLTQDRIAFPYGCGAEERFDRYCSDGSFDYYDFRSENERRTSTAADLSLRSVDTLAGLRHQWSAGVLATRAKARFQRQAFNYVGTGTLDGAAQAPSDPTLTDENTERDERSIEWRLQDVVTLSPTLQLWGGLRVSRIEREAVRTDGSRATAYAQSFTTPWLALAWWPTQALTVYASAGRGLESEVAPNRARYTNAGSVLPALASRQTEAGLKWQDPSLQAALTLFDTRRPQWSDLQDSTGLPSDACSNADPCTRRVDGSARHRGLEAEAEWRAGALVLRGSVLVLRARREGGADPASRGLRPTNVPERSAKLQAAWNLPAWPGLALLGFVSHEGRRAVLPDNGAFTQGWTRLDLGARYATTAGGQRWTWHAGVDNAVDKRAWKESPYQFGHAYLYPLPPRTWRLTMTVAQ